MTFVYARLFISAWAVVALGGSIYARDIENHHGREVSAREVIVKFKTSIAAAVSAGAQGDADADRMVSLSHTDPVFLLHSRSKNVQALLDVLKKHGEIEYAEPNFILHTTASANDPNLSQVWGVQNTGQNILGQPGTTGADIAAYRAWDITTGSTANVVGIIDTGADYNHPDLAANIWSAPTAFTVTVNGSSITCPAGSHGYNAIARTCDPMDDHGHGTHVAGTIGATGNNSVGVVGVNWTTRIMPLKFIDATGSGSSADAITLIDFAIQVKRFFGISANVRVLSNSYGGDGYSQAFSDAIARANTADMLFVASAGNASSNNDVAPSYPANYALPNVVSVAATDNRDALATFSNVGANTVHLGAPGVSILSTVLGGNYAWMSGTSMAAPHVAGAAMLILSKCSLNTAALRNTVLSNVDAKPAFAGLTTTGGRLNVNRALQACAAPATSSSSAAAFVQVDAVTHGTWRNMYGSEGYQIANDGMSLPAYVQMSMQGQSPWTWAASTTDGNALQKAASSSDRIASCWYAGTSFAVDLNFTDGHAHTVAFYLLDFDRGNRSQRVEVVDVGTGAVLSTQAASNFATGQYLVWTLSGHVQMRITRTGAANVVLSGVFFGPAGSAPAPAPVASSATAVFSKVDTTTQGNWVGTYGAGGYNIATLGANMPAYAQVTLAGQSAWTWAGSTTDARALQKPARAADRIASTWYAPTSFTVDIKITDGQTHTVAVYCVDWDYGARGQKVDVLDANTGAVLDTRALASFTAGQYLVWNVSGSVRLQVTRTNVANAVVSGLFFGQ